MRNVGWAKKEEQKWQLLDGNSVETGLGCWRGEQVVDLWWKQGISVGSAWTEENEVVGEQAGVVF